VRFLEVGCGEGLVADGIHRTAADLGLELSYTGLDVSASAVELARTHVSGNLLVGDAHEVLAAMEPGSQDIVMGKNLLHHLDDPARFLRAAGRVVGPGGRVVIFEPNLGCPQFLLFNTLAFKRERHYFKGRRRNLRAFADAGLDIVHTEQFSWLPYELAFVIRYDWFRRLFSTGDPATIAKVSHADDRLAESVPALACYTVWSAAPRQ
jgi:SAM-dependent methyltransferase